MKITLLLFVPAHLSHAAIIIDDFSRGATNLDTINGLGSNSLVEESFRNPSPDFQTLTRSLQATYSSSLVLDPARETLRFTATGSNGNGNSNSNGYYSLRWSFDNPTDLLADGGSAFQIDIVGLLTTGRWGSEPALRINGERSFSSVSESIELSEGSNFVPFTHFPDADFSRIESLEIRDIRISSGTTLTFDSFSVVPESTAFSLATIGCLSLFARRR